MKRETWTTKVKTRDGKIYDLGERQRPPFHEITCQCAECDVINAWPERVEVDRG